MYAAGHQMGAAILRKFKTGASFATAGVPTVDETDGIQPGTTTDWADTVGLAVGTATHTTTPTASTEGLIEVDVNPQLIVGARISGGAAASTAMTLLSNTAEDTTKLIVTDADVGTASLVGGLLWCTKGANVGQSRIIVTFNSGADIRATVAFPYTIAVGDEFLFTPFSNHPHAAMGNVQATTGLAEADGSIVAGTGGVCVVVDVEMLDRLTSKVLFIFGDHVYGNTTTL